MPLGNLGITSLHGLQDYRSCYIYIYIYAKPHVCFCPILALIPTIFTYNLCFDPYTMLIKNAA